MLTVSFIQDLIRNVQAIVISRINQTRKRGQLGGQQAPMCVYACEYTGVLSLIKWKTQRTNGRRHTHVCFKLVKTRS